MRKIFLSLVVVLGSCALQAQNIEEKLEAYFSFDNRGELELSGVASDDSGNGSKGSLVGDMITACGARDTALRFDGDDDAVLFVGPFREIFTTSDFSISFYFKPAPVDPNQGGAHVIMSKQESCNTDHAFWVRYNPISRVISSAISENDSLLVSVQAKLEDPEPCWQFVVLTRKSNVYTLYINGKLRDTRTSVGRIDLESDGIFKLGEPVCVLDRPYRGDLDELRFYSRELSEEDVFALNLRPDRIATPDTLIYLGNSFEVKTISSCATEFYWTPATGVSDVTLPNPVITPEAPTTYKIQFKHYDECLSSDTIFVKVVDPDTLDCSKIFIPSAFSPGTSPGLNDVFRIQNPFSIDQFISFEVFDRWGSRVFDAKTPFEWWDGSFNGKPLNPGLLLYRLRWKCEGEENVKTGTLTLLR